MDSGEPLKASEDSLSQGCQELEMLQKLHPQKEIQSQPQRVGLWALGF